MKILALELSTAQGSLAWLSDGGEPVVRRWPNDRKHSGKFFENLTAVKDQFGLPDTIVVGLGPGSYAGVRIAISTAIGLREASDARLIGAPSICAMESGAEEYCVLGDARRQAFFFAHIRGNEMIEGPTLFGENELRERLESLGSEMLVLTSEKLPQFGRATVGFPTAAVLARLARDSRRAFALPPLEPMYLREPHITVPRTADHSKIAL